MSPDDYTTLVGDLEAELARGACSVGILGLTKVTIRILTEFRFAAVLKAVYTSSSIVSPSLFGVPVLPMAALAASIHDLLMVAADEEKEDLLRYAFPFVSNTPKVIFAGYGHLRFREPALTNELAGLLVPSLANGYPNTLNHIYQCLSNSAKLGLKGVVAEFGMFKGGTTMLLSRLIQHLGEDWPVIGFDTFGGFPPRRSFLDMYDHPDCVFHDLASVRRNLADRNVEIVAGDIVETSRRLEKEDIVLTFVDTDNYTSAKAALDIVQDRTVIGGAIVFDHFAGVDRFRYTLGERIAGKVLLDDIRYFHLHDTGVFYRQR